ERVAIADRDGLVLRGLAIDRDAERRAGLVLTTVTAADRSAVVVEHIEVLAQIVVNLVRELRHAVLVDEREDGRLERRDRRLEFENDARFAALRRFFAAHFFFAVRVTQHYERGAIGAGRRLDDVREKPLVRLGIEVLELLARVLLMVRQIEVGPVVDPLELVPAERELVLDVVGVLGVMRELVFAMLMPAQLLGPDAERLDPFHPLRAPELEPLVLAARLDEELHLHLLEFTGAENEIAGGNFVAERFAHLRDPERNLLAR